MPLPGANTSRHNVIITTELTVYVYRPGAALQTLENPSTLSGEPGLPGFVFNISEIW